MTEPTTQPGESLLLPDDPAELLDRFTSFVSWSGLPSSQVVSSTVSRIPVPQKDRAAGPRGWPANVNPEFLTSAMAWLPDDVAFRLRILDSAGEHLETDDEFCTRIALELTASGVYNAETGAWLNPLGAIGFDLTNPADRIRVEQWLNGNDDPDLDGLDLGAVFAAGAEVQGSPTWAAETASVLLPLLKPASWALQAESLIEQVSAAIDDGDEVVAVTAGCATLALATLSEVPADPDRQPFNELWAELADELAEWDGDHAALIAGPVEQLTGSLQQILDGYWPYLVELEQIDD